MKLEWRVWCCLWDYTPRCALSSSGFKKCQKVLAVVISLEWSFDVDIMPTLSITNQAWTGNYNVGW